MYSFSLYHINLIGGNGRRVRFKIYSIIQIMGVGSNPTLNNKHKYFLKNIGRVVGLEPTAVKATI